MPIRFTVFADKGYFESRYTGKIDDATLLESYREFIEGGGWHPSLNELADLSDCDLTAITSDGIIRMQKFAEKHMIEHHVTSTRTAFYAPNVYAYGIANIYAAFAVDSSEHTAHFKDRVEAELWLVGG